jgi:N utilization substance protein A
MVETLIEEGFLSFDDLTFLEPAHLAELIGVTEEQADEMILFAEEAAEQVGEEARHAKAEEAATPRAPSPPPQRTGPPTAADLFPEPLTATAEEPRITAEQLFGPDTQDTPVATEQVVVVSEKEGEPAS